MEAFFIIHKDLPREGPGDDESLTWAVSHLDLPRDARILDAGCGPGADIPGLLGQCPDGTVLALDTHAPFIDSIRARFAGDTRVTADTTDMTAPPGRFDLIWSAGAVYFLGVQAALEGWRDHLSPGGTVVFSELSWQVTNPAPAAKAFWAQYEAMQHCDGVLRDVAAAGYRVVAHRYLPDAAWEAYYGPLEARIEDLRGAEPTADLIEALDAEQTEIDLWRAHRHEFGYLQVVAVPE